MMALSAHISVADSHLPDFHPVTPKCAEAALYALSAPLRATSGYTAKS